MELIVHDLMLSPSSMLNVLDCDLRRLILESLTYDEPSCVT